jgi:hypothetical protein
MRSWCRGELTLCLAWSCPESDVVQVNRDRFIYSDISSHWHANHSPSLPLLQMVTSWLRNQQGHVKANLMWLALKMQA